MNNNYIEKILKARVYDVAIESPLDPAPRLSRRLGNACCSSARTCSRCSPSSCAAPTTRSRTCRDAVAARGVICASAGNHAQGVALAARKRGIRAVIVMPQHDARRSRCRRWSDLGGEVVLHGDDYDEAYEHALVLDARAQPDLRASLRRSGRDRRPGHDRRWRSCASTGGDDRRDLRAGRRRRADRRHRRLREVRCTRRCASSASSRRTRRRCTNRCRPASASRSSASASSPTASRCGASARRPSALARSYVDEVIAGRHRRDLRGDPGHLRGHALDRRAGRRAGGRGHQALRRARSAARARRSSRSTAAPT